MAVRIVLYCLLGGLPLCIAALGADHLPLFLFSGVVLSAAFVPVARFGPRSVVAQFAVIVPVLLIVTTLCIWSESILFIPATRAHAIRDLVSESVMFLVLAAVLAIAARILKLHSSSGSAVPRRGVPATILLVIACGVMYAVYYLVFGGITYEFFTKKYFPDANQVVARLGVGWFWLIQVTRGVLMTAAVLPAVYSLRMKRWHAALAIGLLLWIAGGGALLLVPNPAMVGIQRFYHIVEIMTQNVALGITALLWLRPHVERRSKP